MSIDGGVLEALGQLSWQRAGRGDRIANVLLYLPLGFCLFLWLATRFNRLASMVLATLGGALLSLIDRSRAGLHLGPRARVSRISR